MSAFMWTTAFFFLLLWNYVKMDEKQCQAAKNVLIERLQGVSGVVSRVTVNYGSFTTCVVVQNNAIIGSQIPASARIEKPPPGPLYELVPSIGYYKLHNEPKTWDQALEICEREGAHLAIPNNRREALLYMELHNRLPALVDDWMKDYGFIGVQKRDNVWVTIFDEPLTKLGLQWAARQPKQVGEGDCAILHTQDGLLQNTDCDTALPFFCEQEL